jgi:hypothetical protein
MRALGIDHPECETRENLSILLTALTPDLEVLAESEKPNRGMRGDTDGPRNLNESDDSRNSQIVEKVLTQINYRTF